MKNAKNIRKCLENIENMPEKCTKHAFSSPQGQNMHFPRKIAKICKYACNMQMHDYPGPTYVHCGLSVLVYQSQFHFITEIFMKRSCRCFYSLYIIFEGKAFVVVVVVVTLLAVVDTMMLKLYDRMQT